MFASTWNFGNGPLEKDVFPIGSMHSIFANIYHKNQPNVGRYTIHGSYGLCFWNLSFSASKGFERWLHSLQSVEMPTWDMDGNWIHGYETVYEFAIELLVITVLMVKKSRSPVDMKTTFPRQFSLKFFYYTSQYHPHHL